MSARVCFSWGDVLSLVMHVLSPQRALALNCHSPINEEGAEADDWRQGKPVRVVRNMKGGKHSKYAPAEGNRYDGIYKVSERTELPVSSSVSHVLVPVP